jgi:pyruvate/2-oxoglutarate dehydrogenase complex dihydrolipoamide acyltransferase (E2) component
MAGFSRVASVLLGLTRLPRLKGGERREYYSLDPSKRLTEKDINAGTVVVSNIGSIQGGHAGMFGLIDIVAPQVFAIGISAVAERPSVITSKDGEKSVGIRSILPFCLVFDHRAFEFGELLPFLKRLDQLFANPSELLPLTGVP